MSGPSTPSRAQRSCIVRGAALLGREPYDVGVALSERHPAVVAGLTDRRGDALGIAAPLLAVLGPPVADAHGLLGHLLTRDDVAGKLTPHGLRECPSETFLIDGDVRVGRVVVQEGYGPLHGSPNRSGYRSSPMIIGLDRPPDWRSAKC